MTHGWTPAQIVVLGFAAVIMVGTGLLALPWAREGQGSATLVEALFTSTSAVCVTGLVVVDTAAHWSTFGEIVILCLIQVGGFGIMTMATLLVMLISRRMRLRSRLAAATETRSLGLGDVRGIIVGVAKISVAFEVTVAVLLWLRLVTAYDVPPGQAAYESVFHAVSAFNNAGFSLYSDSLMRFVSDPWFCLPIAITVICGGIGFPVLLELRRQFRRPRQWSLHTKITVWGTVLLLVSGTAFVLASEWGNDATLGALGGGERWLAAFFHSTMLRTAGFNSLDVAQMSDVTWLGSGVLMFIGGGSAGTAGGIKVATFFLLLFVIYAEIRGERSVNVFDRRVGSRAQRQALTVALLAVAAVTISTLILLAMTDLVLNTVLFEAISAFATVGLSTGITAELPAAGQLVLVILMFVGRLGPITLASALALRQHERLYEQPEGRPIIG
ncbi:TrkH family potassium uptake protein [Jiangella gansuensis]|uniref:TrkH family potassium uptake protein n=1 Tax=Jiangella gansuensis TaxID=281473 RepID=UPI00047DCD90|nr:potassium transporter TrkG [Jiangella gansuensis]